jgi:hypothetical protein
MNDKFPKKILNMNLKRKCQRARPKSKWEEQVREISCERMWKETEEENL